MRPLRATVLILLSAALMELPAAQAQRPDAVSSYRLTPSGAPAWTLLICMVKGSRGLFPTDWYSARLITEGLRIDWIPAERWAESVRVEGASTLRWALKGPDGAIEPGGPLPPDGPGIEALLRSRMGPLPWDGLDAVLKAEPDHGEARRIQAVWLMWWFNYASQRRHPELRQAALLPSAQVARDALTSLDRLLKVPDWPEHLDLGATEGEAPLGILLPVASTQEQRLRMADQLLDALSRDPESEVLQRNMAWLLRILDRDGFEARIEQLEQLEPLPGQAWPPSGLAETALRIWAGKQAWGQLRTKAGAWSRNADRLHLDEPTWKARLAREGMLRTWGHVASSWLQGWTVLTAALDDLRESTGPDYPSHARTLLRHANLPVDNPDLLKELYTLAARPALPGPPMPAPWPPLVLATQDAVIAGRAIQAFDSPHLMLWLPNERRVETRQGDGEVLQLALGGQLLSKRGEWPGEAWLGSAFLAARPGRLIQAMDSVAQRPEAAGPRRRRIRFLLQRFPLRSLEDLLAGDLRRIGEAADLKDWPLDENLWYTEAQRALPEIEVHLRRWPLDSVRWRAFAFWSTFLPAHAGPTELATQLPSWKPKLALTLCLTRDIHAAVAGVLEERRAWGSLRRWCDLTLEGINAIEDPGQRRKLGAELAGVLAGFHDLALRSLGQEGELRSARASWRQLQEPDPR